MSGRGGYVWAVSLRVGSESGSPTRGARVSLPREVGSCPYVRGIHRNCLADMTGPHITPLLYF